MSGSLELVLFARDEGFARTALAAGIHTLIVDWEDRGKRARQHESDTEIDPGTPDDLARLAGLGVAGAVSVWCRVNAIGPWTAEEIEAALAAGATRLLLPMVRQVSDVERFLDLLAGRRPAGILVETDEAVGCARELARLPIDTVYVGLNDLAISRGYRSLFDGVRDGTVERVRQAFPDVRFGFGGVTTVDGGAPIPCLKLLEEMERLGSQFSFLRRSFRRDMVGRDMRAEVARLRACWAGLAARPQEERARHHRELWRQLGDLAEAAVS